MEEKTRKYIESYIYALNQKFGNNNGVRKINFVQFSKYNTQNFGDQQIIMCSNSSCIKSFLEQIIQRINLINDQNIIEESKKYTNESWQNSFYRGKDNLSRIIMNYKNLLKNH